MFKILVYLILSFFLFGNNSFAGFGPVKNSEIIPISGVFGIGIAASILPPVFTIDRDGNGQMVWQQMFYNTGTDDATMRIYAQSISSNNVFGELTTLVENERFTYVLHKQDSNGNAVIYYEIESTGTEESELWTIIYDVSEGWQAPTKIPSYEEGDDVQVLMDSEGESFIILKNYADQFSIYQYQANNTWLLIKENIIAESIGMGANDRLYREFEGDTPETGDKKFIAFLNTTNAEWESAIELPEKTYSQSILIGSEGDIFSINMDLKLIDAVYTYQATISKYEADNNAWETDANGPQFSADALPILVFQLLGNGPVFLNEENDNAKILMLLSSGPNTEEKYVKTIEYAENGGWGTLKTVTSSEDNPLLGTAIFTSLFTQSHILQTTGSGKAAMLICSNDCKDYYGKVYESGIGWSEDLYLPGLAAGSNSTCTDKDAIYTRPQLRMNKNGDIIALNRFWLKSEKNSFSYKLFAASLTGNISTLESDTSCVQDNAGPNTDTGDSSPSSSGSSSNDKDENSGAEDSDTEKASISFTFLLFLFPAIFARIYRN